MRRELGVVKSRLHAAGASPHLSPLLAMCNSEGAAADVPSPAQLAASGGDRGALFDAIARLQRPPGTSAGTAGGGDPAAAAAGEASMATFELYLNPGGDGEAGSTGAAAGAAGRAGRLAAVERRVLALERALGQPTSGSPAGPRTEAASGGGSDGPTSSPSSPSLASLLASLESRVGRLEPDTVARARKELQPLQAALAQVAADSRLATQQGKAARPGAAATSGSGSGDAPEHEDAVAALFRRTQVVDDFGAQLPHLVARLRSLASVHALAVGAANRLGTLEAGQAALGASLSADREALKRLEASLAGSLAATATSVANVDERLAALASCD